MKDRSTACGLSLPLILLSIATAAVPRASAGEGSSEPGSRGVVSLVGIDESAFNPGRFPLWVGFALANETYDPDPSNVRIFLNRDPLDVPSHQISIEPHLISVILPPAAEHNSLGFWAIDSHGRLLEGSFSYWAGPHTVFVTVLDEDGWPLVGATVITTLSQDGRISSRTTTDAQGVAQVTGLPGCCVSYLVHGANGAIDSAAGAPSSGSRVELALRGFNPPSDVDNNDFHLGLDGWETADASVSIVPHQEKPSGITPSADGDLAVCAENGAPPKVVSRTFRITPGMRSVTVRYRFATSETSVRRSTAPDAACSDWFSVELRAVTSRRSAHETYSVSGLGADAFTAIESTHKVTTHWREIKLDVDSNDEVVQVDVRAHSPCSPDGA